MLILVLLAIPSVEAEAAFPSKIENVMSRLVTGLEGVSEDSIRKASLPDQEVRRFREIREFIGLMSPSFADSAIAVLKLLLIPLLTWWAVQRRLLGDFYSRWQRSCLVPLIVMGFGVALDTVIVAGGLKVNYGLSAVGQLMLCWLVFAKGVNRWVSFGAPLFITRPRRVHALFILILTSSFLQKPLISWDELMNWIPFSLVLNIDGNIVDTFVARRHGLDLVHWDYPPLYRVLLMLAAQIDDRVLMSVNLPFLILPFWWLLSFVPWGGAKGLLAIGTLTASFYAMLNMYVAWVPYANLYLGVLLGLTFLAIRFRGQQPKAGFVLILTILIFQTVWVRPEGFVYPAILGFLMLLTKSSRRVGGYALVSAAMFAAIWQLIVYKAVGPISSSEAALFSVQRLQELPAYWSRLVIIAQESWPWAVACIGIQSIWLLANWRSIDALDKSGAAWMVGSVVFVFILALVHGATEEAGFRNWVQIGFVRYVIHPALLGWVLVATFLLNGAKDKPSTVGVIPSPAGDR